MNVNPKLGVVDPNCQVRGWGLSRTEARLPWWPFWNRLPKTR